MGKTISGAASIVTLFLLVVTSCVTKEPQRRCLSEPQSEFSLIETFQCKWGAREAECCFAPAGGVCIMANVKSREYAGDDVNIALFGEGGNLEWSKKLRERSGYGLCSTRDGGYVIIGSTMPQRMGRYHLCPQCVLVLTKIDGNGNELWSMALKGEGRSEGRSVQETNDGGYIVAGSENVREYPRMCLIKTDWQGRMEWNRSFGEGETVQGLFAQQTTDGGYIAVGATIRGGDADVYVVKTDDVGRELWSRSYGDSALDVAYVAQQTADGGYLVVGTSESEGTDNCDMYVTKLGTDGGIEWSKTLGGRGDQVVQSITSTVEGGFFIVGVTDSDSPRKGGGTRCDPMVVMIDKNGKEVWSRVLAVPGNGIGAKVRQVDQGEYVFICGGLRAQDDGSAAVFGLFRLAVPLLSLP